MNTGHIYIFILKPHGHGTYLYFDFINLMNTGHIYIFILKPHGLGTYLYIYFKTSWTRDIFIYLF